MRNFLSLTKRDDFLAVKKESFDIVANSFILKFHRRSGEKNPLFGFIVSKKVDKRAVIRNKIKRRLREAIRIFNKCEIPPGLYVIIARKRALDCPFAMIEDDLKHAFEKIEKNNE